MKIRLFGILFALWVTVSLQFLSDAQPVHFKEDSIAARQLYADGIALGLNNEPDKALALIRESAEIRKRIYGETNTRVAIAYIGMALQYNSLHQLDSAYRCFTLAEQIYTGSSQYVEDYRLAELYGNMAEYFKLKGNITEAIRYNEMAVSLYQNSGEERNGSNHLTALYNMALYYSESGRKAEALRILRKYMEKGNLGSQIRYKSLIASIYTSLKDFSLAKKYRQSIIREVSREYGNKDMRLGDQYYYYALLFIGDMQYDSAFIYLKKAESVYQNYTSNRFEMGRLYRATADAYSNKNISASTITGFQEEKTNNLLHAAEYYLKSLKTYNPGMKNSHPLFDELKVGSFPKETLTVLRELGNSYRQLANLAREGSKYNKTGYLLQSAECLLTGTDLIKHIRTGFISEESKLQFIEIQQGIFNSTLETTFELYSLTHDLRWAEATFVTSESNKAISLFDKISETRSRQSGLIPDSLLQKENHINSSLAYYREILYDKMQKKAGDSAAITNLKSRIFDLEQQNNHLREFLEKNYRDYYAMKYNTEPVSFKSVQQQLKRNDVLLVFSLTQPGNSNPGALYAFAISDSEIRLIRQQFSSQDVEKVNLFYKAVSDPGFLSVNRQDFKDYCESAYDLYIKLISPFSTFIGEKRITIIPDGILNYIPFEALLTQDVPVNSIHYHDLPYFLKKNAILYCYSAVLLGNIPQRSIFHTAKALAFSPEYPEFSLVNKDTIRLSRIPGIYEEVNYLKKKIRTVSFNGKTATEKNLRENAGRYNILHLATHTLINDTIPLFSRLAFYPEDPDSLVNDGWLTLSDVCNLRLNSSMTVLSACQTGTGVLRKGEGIMSLARGFLYAGSQSVILTLWEAEDNTGAIIMKDFYKNLKSGKRKDTALRNAKIKFLSTADPLHAHPHIWLSYIVIGNPEPIFRDYQAYLYTLMIMILGYLSFEIINRKRTDKNEKK